MSAAHKTTFGHLDQICDVAPYGGGVDETHV